MAVKSLKIQENMLLKNLICPFGIGALLVAICAGPSSNSALADDTAKGDQNMVATGALPAPGTYKVDPDHSFAYFGARHHVVGLVRGRFDKVTGTITVATDLAACGVDIAVAAYSISTQNTERDDDLRGPDFFDVNRYPTMTYHGRGIRRISGSFWALDGALTIRGVTEVVPLTFTFKGSFPDTPIGKPARVAFHGVAGAKRADFGMTRDNLMELSASPPSGPDVEIQIDVEADAIPTK